MNFPTYDQFVTWKIIKSNNHHASRVTDKWTWTPLKALYDQVPDLWWAAYPSSVMGGPSLVLDNVWVVMHEAAHLVTAKRAGKDVTDPHFGLGGTSLTTESFHKALAYEIETIVYQIQLCKKLGISDVGYHTPVVFGRDNITPTTLEDGIEAIKCHEKLQLHQELALKKLHHAWSLSEDEVLNLFIAGVKERAERVEEWIFTEAFKEYRVQFLEISKTVPSIFLSGETSVNNRLVYQSMENFIAFYRHTNNYKSSDEWVWLLKQSKDWDEYCPWDKLTGQNWVSLILHDITYSEKCLWHTLQGWEWVRVLEVYPQFIDKCKHNKLNELNWKALLILQPQLAVHKK